MTWTVVYHLDFEREYADLPRRVQDELLAATIPLKLLGPALGRPNADTLAGSQFANMKELRFKAAGGVWRVAFAFDPERKAIFLVAGDKRGINQIRFYDALIRKADTRFAAYLKSLKES